MQPDTTRRLIALSGLAIADAGGTELGRVNGLAVDTAQAMCGSPRRPGHGGGPRTAVGACSRLPMAWRPTM